MALEKFKKTSSAKKTKKLSGKCITDASMESACDDFIRTTKDLKNAKAAHELAQSEIIDYMIPKHFDSLRGRCLEKTFRLNDKVMCIFADRFKNVSSEDQEIIRARLSQQDVPVERLFTERLSIKLRPEIEDNDEELNKLVELLGEEKFEQYFEYDVKFSPVSDFYRSLVETKTVEVLEDIVEQIRYKPTVKIG